MRVTVALLALIGSLIAAPSAFAWTAPICNPATGEVIPPGAFATEAAYNQYLAEHAGSFKMGPGETCHKPALTPSPTPDLTPTPSPTATPTPAPTSPPSGPPPSTPSPPQATSTPEAPMPGPGELVAICHYEPTTGNIERRNVHPDQVEKRLKLGDTLMVPRTTCLQPTPKTTPTPVPPAPPAAATPEVIPPPAPVVAPVVTPIPDVTPPPAEVPPVVPTETPEATPPPVPPPLGDGSAADELVP